MHSVFPMLRLYAPAPSFELDILLIIPSFLLVAIITCTTLIQILTSYQLTRSVCNSNCTGGETPNCMWRNTRTCCTSCILCCALEETLLLVRTCSQKCPANEEGYDSYLLLKQNSASSIKPQYQETVSFFSFFCSLDLGLDLSPLHVAISKDSPSTETQRTGAIATTTTIICIPFCHGQMYFAGF